jgi:hypothetical protein
MPLSVAVANAPAARSGMSSGLVNVGRLVGATLGVAFLGLMFGPRIEEVAKDAPAHSRKRDGRRGINPERVKGARERELAQRTFLSVTIREASCRTEDGRLGRDSLSLTVVNMGHASLDDNWEGIKLDERRL